MRKLSTTSQFITLNFDTPELGAAEALRGILTTQLETPADMGQFGERVKQSAETGKTVIEAVDLELENFRFSNNPAIRAAGDDLRKIFTSWRIISDSGEKSVSIIDKAINLTNALNLISLSVRLIWLTDLQNQRADWLSQYNSFAKMMQYSIPPKPSPLRR